MADEAISRPSDSVPSQSGRPTLALFDFDHSLIDDNSDTYIFQQLAPELMEDFRTLRKMEDFAVWTDVMDEMMRLLHVKGVKEDDIRKALATIPMSSGLRSALSLLHQHQAHLVIISDANTFFIQTILQAYGFGHLFKDHQIYTNPAHFDDQGRCRVCYHHNQAQQIGLQHKRNDSPNTHQSPTPIPVAVEIPPSQPSSSPHPHQQQMQQEHKCERCPKNMCKGMIFDAVKNRHPDSRVIYLGDGAGDLCPALRMSQGDWVLARKDYPLHRALEQNQAIVNATVKLWSNGDEALALYQSFLNGGD